ncbi:MAG: UDP-N-acetylmuramate--L-alanine ligase [Acidobacteriota bacterium]|nr:UDP-N-acetylmuramate--L-alanine ligase [Acidobacteriota bacterium]
MTMMFQRFSGLSRVHFVGIGGAGMSSIAEVLLEYDFTVTGSDQADNETTQRLSRLGIDVRHGHDPEHVEGADLVVVSSAIPADNPELMEARRQGITVVGRAEMLGELMRLKYGIAVAGTHGKTTTTSLIGTLLTETGLDPTVIVGGRLRVTGTGARLGRSDLMVAEADEYDRSFLRLSPIVAVITSIDSDHLDTYRDLAEIEEAFITFARRVPFFGRVVLCLDDPNIQRILPRLADRRVLTYGLTPQADLSAAELESLPWGTRFKVVDSEAGELGTLEVPIPGQHNVANALAAVAVARSVGLEQPELARALASFGGVHRRFEQVGSWHGARVVDDYAHHPTEVAAALKAARQVSGSGRVIAIFQPHLYSRTAALAEDFGRALLAADRVLVTDVYGSREEPVEGVTGELVVSAARRSGHRQVEHCPTWQEAPERLAQTVQEGDLVITLGAGDVYRLAAQLAEAPTPEVPA